MRALINNRFISKIVKIATQVLKDGDEVEVDADNGIVHILKKSKA